MNGKQKNVSIDPELLSLVKDKRKEGWNDGRIREWLTKEHSLYSGEQVSKIFSVLNKSEEPQRKKAVKEKKIREKSYKIEKIVFLLLITAVAVFFVAISPLPQAVGAYLLEQQPGSCAYLNNRYCGRGIKIKEADGHDYLSFSLPSGSLVFAPFTGVYAYDYPDYASRGIYTMGNITVVSNNTTTTFEFYSYFQPIVSSSTIVTKGEPIAIVKGAAVDEANNSNFLVRE